MKKEVKIPKYVLKLLDDRRRAFARFDVINGKLSDYCDKIGLDWSSPFYEDACLRGDIRIFGEVDCGNSLTLKAVENQLRYNNENDFKLYKNHKDKDKIK